MNEHPTYPEMGFDGSFNFTCGEHVSCFLACCTGTRIWLYPYDVLRISRFLGLTSTELLQRYCKFFGSSSPDSSPDSSPFAPDSPDSPGFPVLLLKSADEGKGRCPFAMESGCTIYPDRPWICRLFPVIPVECRTDLTAEADRRFNILVWEGCCGVGNGPAVTIREWWRRAGIAAYEESYLDWQQLTEDLKSSGLLPLAGEAAGQFILGSYDLDLFRKKLLAGEFRKTLPLDKAELERAGNDDIFLLQVACRWLRKVLLEEDA
jgi:uncharacterized protein